MLPFLRISFRVEYRDLKIKDNYLQETSICQKLLKFWFFSKTFSQRDIHSNRIGDVVMESLRRGFIRRVKWSTEWTFWLDVGSSLEFGWPMKRYEFAILSKITSRYLRLPSLIGILYELRDFEHRTCPGSHNIRLFHLPMRGAIILHVSQA